MVMSAYSPIDVFSISGRGTVATGRVCAFPVFDVETFLRPIIT